VADTDPNTVYVGVCEYREWGVFLFPRPVRALAAESAGLGQRRITTKAGKARQLVAGTNHGMYALERNSYCWHPINSIEPRKFPPDVKKGSKDAGGTKTITRQYLEAR